MAKALELMVTEPKDGETVSPFPGSCGRLAGYFGISHLVPRRPISSCNPR